MRSYCEFCGSGADCIVCGGASTDTPPHTGATPEATGRVRRMFGRAYTCVRAAGPHADEVAIAVIRGAYETPDEAADAVELGASYVGAVLRRDADGRLRAEFRMTHRAAGPVPSVN